MSREIDHLNPNDDISPNSINMFGSLTYSYLNHSLVLIENTINSNNMYNKVTTRTNLARVSHVKGSLLDTTLINTESDVSTI